MTVETIDWRARPAAEIAACLDAEAAAWRSTLAWDVREAWAPVAGARAAGHLPGFVAVDARGAVSGWTCFLTHGAVLQIAMLVSSEETVTRALVDAVLGSPEAAPCDVRALSVRDAAPGLRAALAGRGFGVETYAYLSVPAGQAGGDRRLRGWQPADRRATAELCARAYEASAIVRAFAPRGDALEWHEYVAGLIAGPGCGLLVPDASFVAAHADGALAGAVLTTDIGAGSYHVAQIAVDPPARGCGFGRALLRESVSAAARRGARRVTLLVAESNAPARALYASEGFVRIGAFVVAATPQPRRSSSAALATGGASTRR